MYGLAVADRTPFAGTVDSRHRDGVGTRRDRELFAADNDRCVVDVRLSIEQQRRIHSVGECDFVGVDSERIEYRRPFQIPQRAVAAFDFFRSVKLHLIRSIVIVQRTVQILVGEFEHICLGVDGLVAVGVDCANAPVNVGDIVVG